MEWPRQTRVLEQSPCAPCPQLSFFLPVISPRCRRPDGGGLAFTDGGWKSMEPGFCCTPRSSWSRQCQRHMCEDTEGQRSGKDSLLAAAVLSTVLPDSASLGLRGRGSSLPGLDLRLPRQHGRQHWLTLPPCSSLPHTWEEPRSSTAPPKWRNVHCLINAYEGAGRRREGRGGEDHQPTCQSHGQTSKLRPLGGIRTWTMLEKVDKEASPPWRCPQLQALAVTEGFLLYRVLSCHSWSHILLSIAYG